MLLIREQSILTLLYFQLIMGSISNIITIAKAVIALSVFIQSLALRIEALSTEMRIAVVTGANKGIGREIASQLATSGIFCDVILACRDESRGLEAVGEISKLPNSCTVTYEPLTIGDTASHEAFCDSISKRYEKIDVLVNNAAIAFKYCSRKNFADFCHYYNVYSYH